MAAQRERIFVAGGLEPDTPDADQRFHPIRDLEYQADDIGNVFGLVAAHQILVGDGLGNALVLAVVARVIAAHDSLQLRELTHHVRQQVRFSELRGAVCQIHQFLVNLLGHPFGDASDPLYPFVLATKLVMVDHFLQPRGSISERLLAVLIKEKFRVGQPRTHHALVALDYRRRIIGRDVGHNQELVGQPARGVQQREIFLVHLHGQDQTFLRHLEKSLIEFPDQHIGTLDQRRDFVEQGVVLDRLQARRCGCRLQLANDLGAPLGKARDHRAFLAQLLCIAVGILKHDWVGGGLETVAVCLAAGGKAKHLDIHRIRAVQSDQTMNGTYKIHRAPAISKLVAHTFRDR